MYLIYFTLVVIGLITFWVWLMYCAGVHGTFRVRWGEWENWLLISVILFRSSIAKRGVDIAHQEEQRMIAKHESIEATKYCSLMQLTEAMFEVGGQYRRNVDGHYPGISKSA